MRATGSPTVWTFLSRGELALTTDAWDVDRSKSINARVTAAPHPAYLFVTREGAAESQFPSQPPELGPLGASESSFVANLRRLGVGYRRITTPVVNAIVPATDACVATEVGLAPARHWLRPTSGLKAGGRELVSDCRPKRSIVGNGQASRKHLVAP